MMDCVNLDIPHNPGSHSPLRSPHPWNSFLCCTMRNKTNVWKIWADFRRDFYIQKNGDQDFTWMFCYLLEIQATLGDRVQRVGCKFWRLKHLQTHSNNTSTSTEAKYEAHYWNIFMFIKSLFLQWEWWLLCLPAETLHGKFYVKIMNQNFQFNFLGGILLQIKFGLRWALEFAFLTLKLTKQAYRPWLIRRPFPIPLHFLLR